MQHHSSPQAWTHSKQDDNTAALVRALAEYIIARRMPKPESTIFSGDPLRFNDWKVSFQTLIDRKNIPGEEKIYYLRRYVGGPAKNAIESYFLLGSESAYHAAWSILEERYGNPFLIAKAFRDKLYAWPMLRPAQSHNIIRKTILNMMEKNNIYLQPKRSATQTKDGILCQGVERGRAEERSTYISRTLSFMQVPSIIPQGTAP